MSGYLCNFYDVISSYLILLMILMILECGFNCGVIFGCMNFGVCYDLFFDNCIFYKMVFKMSCGFLFFVFCFFFIKVSLKYYMFFVIFNMFLFVFLFLDNLIVYFFFI